ncbi:MAG: YqaJ viral recombinase family protein [Canibacter sp.]
MSSQSYRDRIVTDGTDRVAWLKARARGITATDVAKLCTPKSVLAAAHNKLHGSTFMGNAYTQHGREREPVISQWAADHFETQPSAALFHAAQDLRHLATPDGLRERGDGVLELVEIKTTNKSWKTIPRNYMRQVWWQQYVLGAERTLFVWEEHRDFVPVGAPEYRWIDRDDAEIDKLLVMVGQLIDTLIQQTSR